MTRVRTNRHGTPSAGSRRDQIIALGAIFLGFVGWWAVARSVGPLLLPTPGEVGAALWTGRSKLAEAAFQTGTAALGGLTLAGVLGVAAAVAGFWSRGLKAALVPYTLLIQVVPIVAIAPLLVVWLGYGRSVALVTAAVAAFYPVFSTATTGLVSASPDWVALFRLYGASRFRELWSLRLVAALPSLFAGLRTAGGLAVIGAIVGEFVGSNGSPPTLGYLIVFGARSAELGLCFAAVSVSAGLALFFLAVMSVAERRLVGRWFGA